VEGEYESKAVLVQMQDCCLELLQHGYYNKFIKSDIFEKVLKSQRKVSLKATYESKDTDPPEIEGFDETKFKLVIKEKISSRKLQKQKNKKIRYKLKAVPFPSDKTMITVGRDLSNYISIGDSGISRVHGRFEWDTHQLIYIDIGSSFGSKLNGEVVHRASINVGDHIQIGRSVISLRDKSWIGDEEGRDDCVGSSRIDANTNLPEFESGSCIIS